MLPAGFSLQFSITDAHAGLTVTRGVVQTSEEALILEFETKDAVLEVMKSGIKQVRIPESELASAELKAGWFTTRLLIRTKGMAVLAGVPGNEAGQIVLRVARKDRKTARELVYALLLSLSERQLASLSKAIRQTP